MFSQRPLQLAEKQQSHVVASLMVITEACGD